MTDKIKKFSELTEWAIAGGKGSSLAQMYQQGYPVPNGFIILPSAFSGGKLDAEAWIRIQDLLRELRKSREGALFAVRSSALSEDSLQASFAGEFETVLNAKTDDDIREAIGTVFESTVSERVKAYSLVQGMNEPQKIAVVIQLMVRPAVSGVLFTADPITGSHSSMTGNYVRGLGERLVSGESNAIAFRLKRPHGKYEGPAEFKRHAAALYKVASKLVSQRASQQDIEWAVENGKLYLLQARPITTMNCGNRDAYAINDSLTGDFLWSNTNVGEAMPGVFTPLSWSLIRAIDEEQSTVPGSYLFSGNICGRLYSNISMLLSIYPAFGKDANPLLKKLENIFGKFPDGMDIPIYPFSKLDLIKGMIPKVRNKLKNLKMAAKLMPQYQKDNPVWCAGMKGRIEKAITKQELQELWSQELYPANMKAFWVGNAGGRKFAGIFKLYQELSDLLGTEQANALLSNLRGGTLMASLGPVVGISKIRSGQMSRQDYLKQYGHRSPHEFELSLADPGEEWLEEQLWELEKTDADVEGLLLKQSDQYTQAWNKLAESFPRKAKRIGKKIEEAAEGSRLREIYRSEWTRVFRVNRTFALKAGELTGIKEDVFYLYVDEIVNLLNGDDSSVRFIPARKENYRKFKELPPLPSIIRGKLNPFKWAEDPYRRVDYYDPSIPIPVSDADSLKGFPGAAGRIEGRVRILATPDEGAALQPGEILVAATTNIGWTPIFPRAAAIITDIGAPLSHAAIVARELGIPAVVGCGNATTKLKTGERVLVDGGHGLVQILD